MSNLRTAAARAAEIRASTAALVETSRVATERALDTLRAARQRQRARAASPSTPDATRRATSTGAYAPPDPYALGLATLKTASATPEADFEAQWKTDRADAFAAEAERLNAHISANPSEPRLTAAEVRHNYAPPDPFAKALEQHRAAEQATRERLAR